MSAQNKAQLIEDAVVLLNSHPQTPTIGYGNDTFRSSAQVHYEYIVGPEMEKFIYGFGLKDFPLTNPTEDQDYLIFEIPKDVGPIICVNTKDNLPDIIQLIGKAGLISVGSYQYAKLPSNKIQACVSDYSTLTEELVIAYISTDPPVVDMTESFKRGVRFGIAAELASKFIQSTAVKQDWERKATAAFSWARKLALEGSNPWRYVRAETADAAELAGPDGRTDGYTNEAVIYSGSRRT